MTEPTFEVPQQYRTIKNASLHSINVVPTGQAFVEGVTTTKLGTTPSKPQPRMFCPRCDRVYSDTTTDKVLEKLKHHVAEQHPDHDPEWFDTYPHPFTD